MERAFLLRWRDEALPDEVSHWYDRFNQVPQSRPAKQFRAWRCHRLASQFKAEPNFANVGLGARHKNSFHVAVAVDSYLNGAPASALPWSYDDDPILAVAAETVIADARPAILAQSEIHARKIVASWGAGAKGILSVRDPHHPTHRVLNVTSQTGQADQVEFFDYSEAIRISPIGRLTRPKDPAAAAAMHLSNIDEHSGFSSIRLWRTADLQTAANLPADLFTQPAGSARSMILEVLPSDMPDASRNETVDRIWFMHDHLYAEWLLTQIGRGACTFDPGQLQRLSSRTSHESPRPLTKLDGSLCWLADRGAATIAGSAIEITIADNPDTWRHLAIFGQAESAVGRRATRRGPIDGLTAGEIEVCLESETLDRVGVEPATYEPPTPNDRASVVSPGRADSWIDSNRAAGTGSRKTNCWNTASAVANYLSTGAPSTSLPIYRDAPLRPTIPEFLALLGVTEVTSFISSRVEADRAVASWGPHTHGLVLAAWSPMSTHIFNVVNNGSSIRYLDGHTAEDGDFNFDVRWERVGIVPIGTLDRRFWADVSPLADLAQGVVGDLRVGLA